jgi:hypothetical protein
MAFRSPPPVVKREKHLKNHKVSRQNRASYAFRYDMLVDLSVPAIQTLGELIQPEKPDMVRLQAAKEILARVDGTPRQQATLEVKTDMTTLHLDALRALAAQAPEIIDVTPVDDGQTD